MPARWQEFMMLTVSIIRIADECLIKFKLGSHLATTWSLTRENETERHDNHPSYSRVVLA